MEKHIDVVNKGEDPEDCILTVELEAHDDISDLLTILDEIAGLESMQKLVFVGNDPEVAIFTTISNEEARKILDLYFEGSFQNLKAFTKDVFNGKKNARGRKLSTSQLATCMYLNTIGGNLLIENLTDSSTKKIPKGELIFAAHFYNHAATMAYYLKVTLSNLKLGTDSVSLAAFMEGELYIKSLSCINFSIENNPKETRLAFQKLSSFAHLTANLILRNVNKTDQQIWVYSRMIVSLVRFSRRLPLSHESHMGEEYHRRFIQNFIRLYGLIMNVVDKDGNRTANPYLTEAELLNLDSFYNIANPYLNVPSSQEEA